MTAWFNRALPLLNKVALRAKKKWRWSAWLLTDYVIKKGKVGYSKSHAAYIQREDGYQSKEEDLVYTESGNMNFMVKK